MDAWIGRGGLDREDTEEEEDTLSPFCRAMQREMKEKQRTEEDRMCVKVG